MTMTSIYNYLLDNPTPSGSTLPDEDSNTGGAGWAPGAQDGVAVYHVASLTPVNVVPAVELLAAATAGEPGAFDELHELLREAPAVHAIDSLLNAVAQVYPEGFPEELGGVARRLATTSPYRAAVKIALSLLGAAGKPDDQELILTLGGHDEFTLFAVTALINLFDDPTAQVFELARRTTGWGRIHAVYRLAGTSDPDVKAWMLREGFENEIMNEYLVLTCATTGGLLQALQQDDVDAELLHGAAEIFIALKMGGPAGSFTDYSDGPVAAEAFLSHLSRLEESAITDTLEKARQALTA